MDIRSHYSPPSLKVYFYWVGLFDARELFREPFLPKIDLFFERKQVLRFLAIGDLTGLAAREIVDADQVVPELGLDGTEDIPYLMIESDIELGESALFQPAEVSRVVFR